MGAGIAQVSAEKGLEVLLKDRNDEAVSRGHSYIDTNWKKKVSKKRMTNYKYNINSSNITGLTDDMENWKKTLRACRHGHRGCVRRHRPQEKDRRTMRRGHSWPLHLCYQHISHPHR